MVQRRWHIEATSTKCVSFVIKKIFRTHFCTLTLTNKHTRCGRGKKKGRKTSPVTDDT